jgi:hypothetical protein
MVSYKATQRQALPARAGFGGESCQTPNPPFGAASLQVRAKPRTCPVHAVLARFMPLETSSALPVIYICHLPLHTAQHTSESSLHTNTMNLEFLLHNLSLDFSRL